MKIKNSRLELERVENLSDIQKIMTRKDLRYKTLYAIMPNSNIGVIGVSFSMSAVNSYTLSLEEMNMLHGFKEYYVISKRLKTDDTKITYTDSEKKILIYILLGLINEYRLDTAEILCHAIENKKILQEFYSDYGRMKNIKELCYKMIESDSIPSSKGIGDLYPYQYQRSRYSIYDLVQDLLEDHSYICTDPELIGAYKKISRGLKKTSDIIGGTWNPILNSSFNKTRANLNLNYLCSISVDIPENEFGIVGPKKLKTIKSICLVKDGVACNTTFGVRIKSKKLVKKLKSAKIIKTNLVYDGDYLIDISRMPVVSKSKTSKIRSFDLATAESWYRLCDIAIEYLKRRYYKESQKLDKIPEKLPETKDIRTPEEVFLNSLGIYGNRFYPTKEVSGVTKIYRTDELVSSINIPTKETCTRNITRLLNGIKCNKFIEDFINSEVIPDINKGTPYENLIDFWECKKDRMRSIIRDLKFRLIAGKSLRVCVHGSKRKSILYTTQKIKVFNYEINVKWDIKNSHVIV